MPNTLIPNSYQTPNLYVDRLMPLLSHSEWRVLCYMARQILGWEANRAKNMADISRGQMVAGKVVAGRQVDLGTGLGASSVKRATASLDKLGIITKVGDPGSHQATRWALQLDPGAIDWAALDARRDSKGQKIPPTSNLGSKSDPNLGSKSDPNKGQKVTPTPESIETKTETQVETQTTDKDRDPDDCLSVCLSDGSMSLLVTELQQAGIQLGDGDQEQIAEWLARYEYRAILAALDTAAARLASLRSPVAYIGGILANQLDEGKIGPPAPPEPARAPAVAPRDPDPAQPSAWVSCQQELAISMGGAHARYVNDARASVDGDHWTIHATSQLARDWLQAKLATTIARKLRSLTGQAVTVTITTA